VKLLLAFGNPANFWSGYPIIINIYAAYHEVFDFVNFDVILEINI